MEFQPGPDRIGIRGAPLKLHREVVIRIWIVQEQEIPLARRSSVVACPSPSEDIDESVVIKVS